MAPPRRPSLPRPALVAVAHGSRDPRSAATVAALIDTVRARRPDLDARLSFLDLTAPRLLDALDAVAADGHRSTVVVPLLLSSAYHARVDIPRAVAAATRRLPRLEIAVAPVLGSRPALLGAIAMRRLAAVAGPLHDPDLGVVLAAVGSSHSPANAAVGRVVSTWARRFGWHGGVAAFATAAAPTVSEAIDGLRASGARRIAVAQWVLAPGLLPDRIIRAARDAGVPVAEPLGTDPALAEVVLDRYDAVSQETHRRAAG